MNINRRIIRVVALAFAIAVAATQLSACRETAPAALGSLEYDRITVPAPVAERIVAIDVREGQHVDAGAVLMTLDTARGEAQVAAAQAEATRTQEALSELEVGPRREAIAQARAQLVAAQAQAVEAQTSYKRIAALGQGKYVAAIDVDRARASAQTATAQVQVAQQALDTLLNGTRDEEIAQGRSAAATASANAQYQKLTLDKSTLVAPRAGRIDSLPYKLGDQAPVGSPLVVMLADNAPYARIYVPEQQRANVKVGDALVVRVDGRSGEYKGRVRAIRNEASFTPYFALTGKDAARLSYLAEVQLGDDARDLPAGLPVSVSLAK
ncbi:MAG: HlyD family efflux transporter periplasmic adaptor subunit [Proteobacteria bacterium]|nr:HlyD family efflux transporter periplasmic adaptor subunit [Pseudomonadota bacterium]